MGKYERSNPGQYSKKVSNRTLDARYLSTSHLVVVRVLCPQYTDRYVLSWIESQPSRLPFTISQVSGFSTSPRKHSTTTCILLNIQAILLTLPLLFVNGVTSKNYSHTLVQSVEQRHPQLSGRWLPRLNWASAETRADLVIEPDGIVSGGLL